MVEFLKGLFKKTSTWVIGALGLTTVLSDVGTVILVVVGIFLFLYAVKVFKK